MFLEVVEDFRSNGSSELLFREIFFVDERLNTWQLVRNFRPLVVDDLGYLPERIDLLFKNIVGEHRQELRSRNASTGVKLLLVLLGHVSKFG